MSSYILYSYTTRGGLGRIATLHLPGGPVGAATRWAATSNVEVGQTTYPVNREKAGMEGEKRAKDRVTKRRRGKEGVELGRESKG